jgi:glycosyltransferase involved in cell wall biosynthesis
VRSVLIGPVYPYRGGIAHYTTALAQALSAHKNNTLLVVSFRSQYPAWLYPGKSDRDPSNQPLHVKAEFLLDPLLPTTWLRAFWRIREFSPQQVIVNWWTTFWAPAFTFLVRWLRRDGIPVTYLIHNVIPHEAQPWDRLLARLALGPGSHFIVQADGEKQRLQRLLPRAHIHLVPHPVYDMFAGQRISRDNARNQLGLPQQGYVLLFFGIVRPYKGLDVLLQALARPELRSLQPVLLVAGEFWEDKTHYLEKAQLLGLSAQVRMEDRYIPNEEVPVFFSAADLLVAPYTGGTQSGAVKMAIGFGLPAVLSHHLADESMDSHIDNTVFLTEVNSPEGLARALVKALRFPSARLPTHGKNGGWDSLVNILEQYVEASSA